MKTFFILCCTIVFFGFMGLVFSKPVYHVVKVQEGELIHYAIQVCYLRITDCQLYYDRWDNTPEGLARAEEDYHFFVKPPVKITVVDVVK